MSSLQYLNTDLLVQTIDLKFWISNLRSSQNSRKPITDLTKLSIDDGGRKKIDIRMVNISSVLEFQRWRVLKSKLFGQESTCHQRKIFKKFQRVMTVHQKVPKLYFQSQFWMSKINQISWEKLPKNINLGDHYLIKHYHFTF